MSLVGEELTQDQGQEHGQEEAWSEGAQVTWNTIMSTSHNGHWSKTDQSDFTYPLIGLGQQLVRSGLVPCCCFRQWEVLDEIGSN